MQALWEGPLASGQFADVYLFFSVNRLKETGLCSLCGVLNQEAWTSHLNVPVAGPPYSLALGYQSPKSSYAWPQTNGLCYKLEKNPPLRVETTTKSYQESSIPA